MDMQLLKDTIEMRRSYRQQIVTTSGEEETQKLLYHRAKHNIAVTFSE